MEKHQLIGANQYEVMYFKYNHQKQELVIGGHINCIDFIDKIVKVYFTKTQPNNVHSQRARIRYVLPIKINKYREAKTQLTNDFGGAFERIERLDRRL